MTIALTIAGSDPSGGAGLQADLKTFHQHGVYGMSVVTLLTVQNTVGVTAVETMAPDLVADQLSAVLSDIPPSAAKTGALGDEEVIRVIAQQAAGFEFPLVVDPVMISKHGAPLMVESAVKTFVCDLLPHAFLVTPNIPESEEITKKGIESVAEMESAAKTIHSMGAKHVLIKGGHLSGAAIDVLFSDGQFHHFRSERIDTDQTHGTGCVTSASITARLARGVPLVDAVREAKSFITRAIETNPGLGKGLGPVNLFASPD